MPIDKIAVNGEAWENYLDELIQIGLIDLEPTISNLLMNWSVQDLRQFAFNHSVKVFGSKQRIIDAIIAQLGTQQALYEFRQVDSAEYIRLTINDIPQLRQFFFAEIDRVRQYLQWVRQIIDPRWVFTTPQPIQAPLSDPNMLPNKGHPLDPKEYLENPWNQKEIALVREIWDSKCDDIVRDVVNEYAWDASIYMIEALRDYLPSERLLAFQQACEANVLRVWYNVLGNYGLVRAYQMGIKPREPRLLTCQHCGKQFREWSIHYGFAKRVGYKIRFCNDCYQRALYRSMYADQITSNDMPRQLAILAAGLEDVPTAQFVKQPNIENLSEEKQIAVITALLGLPSYQAYVSEFGSWLKALIAAGVLDKSAERAGFGVRSTAIDGHVCFSLAERHIDDWLTRNNIHHEKEPVYPLHPDFNLQGRIRADWEVGGIFIEYAGLIDDPTYKANIQIKRKLAAKLGFQLLVIEPKDILNLDKVLRNLLL